MARPLRLEFAGALYHVRACGNERRRIFLGDEDSDRAMFLDVLGATPERFNWVLHAYCLMTNHYHLLVETPDANLSKGMRQLNGVFTQYVNRARARVGHLFQGRFKAILVERESYLLELCRYVVLNPVRARMVAAPAIGRGAVIGRRSARRRRPDGWRPMRCCVRFPKSGMPRCPAAGASSPRASAPPAHGRGSRARSTWAQSSSSSACRRGSTQSARCGRFRNASAVPWQSRWLSMPPAGQTATARWPRRTAAARTAC